MEQFKTPYDAATKGNIPAKDFPNVDKNYIGLGSVIKWKPEYCDSPDEEDHLYVVVEDREPRLLVQELFPTRDWAITPTHDGNKDWAILITQ